MPHHVTALIVSLVCTAGVSACGGTDGDPAGTVTAAQLVDESTEALDDGDWEKAGRLATEAIASESDTEIQARAHANRSVALAYLGASSDSVDDATRALELEPTAPVRALALAARAFAHTGLGQFDDVVADATAALELEPADTSVLAWAYATRGGALNELDRLDESIADTTMAVTLAPEGSRVRGEALVSRSSVFLQLGRLDEALADITTAIDLLDDERMQVAMHYWRAVILWEKGQFEDVVAEATTVVEFEPEAGMLAQSILLRAGAYAELDRLDEAATDLELALAASPYLELEVRRLRDEYGITDPGPADHQQELTAGETSVLAERLVEVTGYTYVDVAPEELDTYRTNIGDFEADSGVDVVAGASWHSVIADDPAQNTTGVEVGFLFLIERNTSIDDSEILGQLRNAWIGGEQIEELDLAGVPVELFENRRLPNSRYSYSWADDDVAGIFDGAERASLERWLTAYLEELTRADR